MTRGSKVDKITTFEHRFLLKLLEHSTSPTVFNNQGTITLINPGKTSA